MITTRSCSWCHRVNVVDHDRPVHCVICGHRADLPRMNCDCQRCRPPAQPSAQQPPANPIILRFTSPGDFVEEITREAAKVERGILRMSFRTTHSVPMYSLAMVCSCVIAGQVVTLERRCGEYMFPDSHEHRLVGEYAEKQADMIRLACAELKLELRSGVLEAA